MATVNHPPYGYSKQDGESELRKSIGYSTEEDGTDILTTDNSSIPEHYKKETGTLPSFLIIVISGGEVREADYLQELSKKHTFPHVKLIFLSSKKGKGGLSPNMMLELLKDSIDFDDQIKAQKISFSSTDKIFMVSDVDHYYNELVEILKTNQPPKIKWIISNPCFEIWLYYSHYDHIRKELEVLKSLPQSQQSSTLKTINDSIVKGGIDPRKAFERIREATDNSKKHYEEDMHLIPKLLSTNMFVLGEYLVDAIGASEFEVWLAEKQKKIEAYRKTTGWNV